jgi:predicted amino acid racemase
MIMFLDLLRRRNPALLDAAAALHASGTLPANTYAIDLDAVGRNAAAFAAAASRLGLTSFAMTKQIGRNPDVSRVLAASGITHAVGVDLQCATAAAAGGLGIGHIGHLVQIPRAEAPVAAALEPRFWTVYDERKAREAGAAAEDRGRVQDVLVRISREGDRFYRGHEGGFPAEDIVSIADRIDAIPGVRFAGITSFPATLFNPASGTAVATPNRATLTAAAGALRAAGRTDVQVNAPGTTSISVLADLAAAGATQVEPGHGLTGTTPLHAVADLEEEPAILYVSEVSHLWNGDAYVFGGGLYVDPVLGDAVTRALVVRPGATDAAAATPLTVEMPAPEAIDYYAIIPDAERAGVQPGDTVLFGFRPQVFVTRALTAAISGVGSTPVVEGLWAADGSRPLGAEGAAGTGVGA